MVDEQPEAVKRSAQDDTRPTSPVQSTGRLDTGQGKTDAFLTERTATSGDYLVRKPSPQRIQRLVIDQTAHLHLCDQVGFSCFCCRCSRGCRLWRDDTTDVRLVRYVCPSDTTFSRQARADRDQATSSTTLATLMTSIPLALETSSERPWTSFGTLSPTTHSYYRPSLALLTPFSLYLFALFLARLVLATIHKLAFRMIGIRLSSAIRLHYLKRLLGQSVHVLDSLPSGHAANTITSSSNTLQLGISEKLGVLIEYTALSIGAIAVAFSKNWELALVTSSGIVLITLIVGAIFPLVVKG